MSRPTERRTGFRRGSGSISCRLCFAWIPVLPERVEESEIYVYYRCQRCEGSFPIRRADVATDAPPAP